MKHLKYTKIDPRTNERVLAIPKREVWANEEDAIELFVFVKGYLQHLGGCRIDSAPPCDSFEWWEVKCLLHGVVISVQPSPCEGSLLVWLIDEEPHNAPDLYSFFEDFLTSYRQSWEAKQCR